VSFQDRGFLLDHIESILDFYAPNIVDSSGGFFQNFRDDGSVFAPGERHLVSSCRMVVNYCRAYELFGDENYRRLAQHGLDFIRQCHWDGVREGFNWTLRDRCVPADQTNHCYGLAFVTLSSAAAHKIGLEGAADDIDRAWEIMESRLWDEAVGLYADEAAPDWSEVGAYRGQNANMHSCEAFIEAFEATGDARFLDRASDLARLVTVDLAAKSDGLIWEHFTPDLDVDWEYNKEDPKNLYRPWGFQPGHQTEWAKLLLTLYGFRPEPWMPARAEELFDRAIEAAWDSEHGGIFYGFAPDRTICDADKYFWVQAESFAASYRLLQQTGDSKYADWYDAIWRYSWEHMIDHDFGAWYRVLTADNRHYSDEKSTAGGKCDYHTVGACWDVLRAGSRADNA
jgi:mannose/cellobiose epimerase-like protein (N-acyl-D-glucosamine 2-epimerase family)